MPVVVLGMHRSGTSMVARILNDAGLYLGPEDELMPASPDNQDGYWENLRFVELNDEMLGALDASWDEPPAAFAADDPALATAHTRAEDLAHEFETHGLWGWKDPRSTLLLPFWLELFPELRIVGCIRNPLEVALSLHRRDNFSFERGLSLWREYNERLLASAPREQLLLAHYEAYFTDPVNQLRRVLSHCGLEASDAMVEQVWGAARRDLRHNRFSGGDLLAAEVSPDVIELYARLCERSGWPEEDAALLRAAARSRRGAWDARSKSDREVVDAEVLVKVLQAVVETRDSALEQLRGRSADLGDEVAIAGVRTGAAGSGRKAQLPCSIVIPVFNHADLTRRCLEAVLPVPDYVEVIVVDDASTDETPEVLASYGDRISVVTHEQNEGFAAACNHGAAEALGAHIVFLNNDTIPTPGWLAALLAYADEHPEAATVGAKLLYPDETVQHAGVVICSDGAPRHIYLGFPADHPAVSTSRRFQVVTAACALFRRDAFDEAGGFDTAYVNGHEDVDLCLRLGELGYEVHYCAESVLYHLESASRDREDSANHRLYRQRWEERVPTDEFRYYCEDGLVEIDYSTSYPFRIRLAPALAERDVGRGRADALVPSAADGGADLTDSLAELLLVAQRIEASVTARPDTGGSEAAAAYDDVVARIQDVVPRALPPRASVLVVSRGDDRLVALEGLQAGHFPQDVAGQYAGWYPANGADAVTELERLRSEGAQYLVVPSTGRWWLDHYRELRALLETSGRLVLDDEACTVYALHAAAVGSTSYARLVHQIREVVDALVPEDAGVVVASKGDDGLLDLGSRPAAHVPRDELGVYAGYHPANSGEALAQLDRAHTDGYRYFVLPAPVAWWVDHYAELREALETRYLLLARRAGVCAVYDLGEPAPAPRHLPEPAYARLVTDVRGIFAASVPPNASLAVASRGDDELLAVPRRSVRHFPATEDGGYAGYYPTDDLEAVRWLEQERTRGVEFVAFPATALWWLDFYPGLAAILSERYRLVWRDERCEVYDIRRAASHERPDPANENGARPPSLPEALSSLLLRRPHPRTEQPCRPD